MPVSSNSDNQENLATMISQLLSETKTVIQSVGNHISKQIMQSYNYIRQSKIIHQIGEAAKNTYTLTIKQTYLGFSDGIKPYFWFGYQPIKNFNKLQTLYKIKRNPCYIIGTMVSMPVAIPPAAAHLSFRLISDPITGAWKGFITSFADYLPGSKEIVFKNFYNQLTKSKSLIEAIVMFPGLIIGTALGQTLSIISAVPIGAIAGGKAAYDFSEIRMPLNLLNRLPKDKKILMFIPVCVYAGSVTFGFTISLITKPMHSKENFLNTVTFCAVPIVSPILLVKRLNSRFKKPIVPAQDTIQDATPLAPASAPSSEPGSGPSSVPCPVTSTVRKLHLINPEIVAAVSTASQIPVNTEEPTEATSLLLQAHLN